MLANNIRVIVARSFADIYRENCLQNGLLPVVLAPADTEAFEKRVIETKALRRSPSISRPRPSAAPAGRTSNSTSRPPTARACSKGSTISA